MRTWTARRAFGRAAGVRWVPRGAWRTFGTGLWLCAWLGAMEAPGVARVMVAFNRAGQGHPTRDLSVYDLTVHRFASDKMDASFCARLAEARILYIGQYAGDDTGKAIFSDAERSAAVRALLQRGGLLFFDYNANPGDGPTAKFFAGLGLDHPGAPSGKDYKCKPAAGSRSPLLTTPRKLEAAGSAYGAWETR